MSDLGKWSRCRPPLRPHVWSKWRVTWAVLGLRERRGARCDKRQLGKALGKATPERAA